MQSPSINSPLYVQIYCHSTSRQILHGRCAADPLGGYSTIWRRRHRHLLPCPPQALLSDTVSKLRNAHDRRVAFLHKFILPRQLVTRQPERIPDNLLVHIALDLKQDLAHGRPARPVVEAALTLTHTLIVSGGVDADVGGHAVVEAVLHATQALLDGLVGDLELLRGDSAVVVLQSDAVVAPHECCAARAAAGRDARSAFARFAGFAGFGSEPVEASRCGREGADGL